MAKEALYISEERLGEVIRVIHAGLKAVAISPDTDFPEPPGVRRETAAILKRWCAEEEKYLRGFSKEFRPNLAEPSKKKADRADVDDRSTRRSR
jgi:hypothetical protein